MRAFKIHSVALSTALVCSLVLTAADNWPDSSLLAASRHNGNRGQGRRPASPKISDVDLTGTIETVQPGGLMIKAGTSSKAKDQKEWLVVPQAGGTEVVILGTATLDYLHKGQLVEFNGQIVSGDHVDGQLETLTIVDKKTKHDATAKKSGGKDAVAAPQGFDRIVIPKQQDDAAPAAPAAQNKQPAGAAGKAAASKPAANLADKPGSGRCLKRLGLGADHVEAGQQARDFRPRPARQGRVGRRADD